MEAIYTPRYPDTRWMMIFGSYDGIEQYATNELQKLIQRYLPYVVEVSSSSEAIDHSRAHLILIGTPENNHAIKTFLQRSNLTLGGNPQGYLLACLDSPWQPGKRVLLVTGNAGQAISYAIQSLGKLLNTTVWSKLLTGLEGSPDLKKSFDALPDFTIHDAPAIEYRGIWTWGYVIRDYRRFLDHMVCLRMNTLIIWNDFPPFNSPEIIEYAHLRGISIIYGFHWGWGLPDIRLADPEDRQKVKEIVIAKYHQYYEELGLDGIYFQTLTEHAITEENGITTAKAACGLVNETSAALMKIKPDLQIYFGLHATSIQENYTDLEPLDPRVTIVWEDAGGIPYAYQPFLDPQAPPEKALDYSKRVSIIRPGNLFAMVPKGWPYLRWEDEFEHHGPYIMGEQNRAVIRHRLEERQAEWNHFNSLWFKHFPIAAHFYREMVPITPAGMMVTGLIEDSGFEETIQPSVAIFAETIWNANRPDEIILQEALNPYYRDV